MIRQINSANNNIRFKEEPKKSTGRLESEILPNTLGIRVRQKYEKTANAVLQYPVKGLKGDVNSDFYEFLSMGIIPYVLGGITLSGLSLITKHLMPKSKILANINGNKMALGVILYGVMKTLSNDFVTRPVAMATGVDIELPIKHVYYPLPTEAGKDANIIPQTQQRKVYDSKEFFRKDLIANDPRYGKKYYDKIAKKLGLGENLNDSVTEVTPIIQNIVSTTKTAKSLSSYAWAGLGVGLALQGSWNDFFTSSWRRKKYSKTKNDTFMKKCAEHIKNFGINTLNITKSFGKSFVNAWKSLWSGKQGARTLFEKHTGKAAILATLALTVGTTLNAIIRAKSMGKLVNKNIIDNTQESTVI